ncbi:MAG TPA: hypothetical protein DCQ50_04660, partial [Chryseobacterium sp.]|nr:hypothetical protein [Chryseobacterium sp.]
ILSTERLKTDKPFLIYIELLELLGNQANRLNRNSFYTWLRRWRQRHSKKDLLPAQKEKEWKEYQAPSLSALSGGNDPIVIEFIKPK